MENNDLSLAELTKRSLIEREKEINEIWRLYKHLIHTLTIFERTTLSDRVDLAELVKGLKVNPDRELTVEEAVKMAKLSISTMKAGALLDVLAKHLPEEWGGEGDSDDR